MPFLAERCPDQRNAPFAIGPADSSTGGDSPRSANVSGTSTIPVKAIALTEGIHTLDTASATSGSEPGIRLRESCWRRGRCLVHHTAQSWRQLTLSTCDLDGWDTDSLLFGDCQSPSSWPARCPGFGKRTGVVCQQYFSRIPIFL